MNLIATEKFTSQISHMVSVESLCGVCILCTMCNMILNNYRFTSLEVTVVFVVKCCLFSLSIDISSVSLPMVCLLHFIKLSDQLYLYQADFNHHHSKRMTCRTLWVPWEATALLIQLLQPRVGPPLPPNQLQQAHHRLIFFFYWSYN